MKGNHEIANVLFTGSGFTLYGNDMNPDLAKQPEVEQQKDMDDDFEMGR